MNTQKRPTLTRLKTAYRLCLTCKPGHHASRGAIALAVQLEERFRALRTALPNLGETLDLLVTLSSLRTTRPRTWALTKGAPPPKSITFWQWLHTHQHADLAQVRDPSEEQTYLDVIAFMWVVATAQKAFCDQVSGLLANPHKSPYDASRQLPRGKKVPAEMLSGALKAGYASWIEALKECTPDSTIHAAYQLLFRIQEPTVWRTPTETEKTQRRLSERDLCKTHWYFPRPGELLKIHEFVHSGLESSRMESGEGASQLRVSPALRNEACLITLAILSSRSVQSILHWPVHTDDEEIHGTDRIHLFEKLLGHNRRFAQWLKAEHKAGSAIAAITLPSEIRDWIRSLHPGVGSWRIIDLLPISKEPWDKRAYSALAKSLGCTAIRAELITRDLLPRLIYEQTANSALVHFFRSSTKNQIERHDRVALSHYLQVQSTRALTTYHTAAKEATGLEIPTLLSSLSVRLGSPPLATEEIVTIINTLKHQTQIAENNIDTHNALTKLTLFLCILGTGHRRSTAPFPFPWDFFPSEGLAFICDKIVTGSEARFVPLTATISFFLKEYSGHLRALASKADLKEETRNYAYQTQTLLGFNTTAPEVAKPTEFRPYAGVFFLITKDGSISGVPLTTNGLDTTIKNLTGIRRAVARARTTVAQQLWERGLSGRAVQAFLGHQPELHVHGSSSTWSIRDVATRINPELEEYFRSELKLVTQSNATWAPCAHYPSLKVSTHDPGNGLIAPGYEGRKRESEWAAQKARAVIQREISEYLLACPKDSGARLDAVEKKRIEDRVREELGSDPIAQKKVLTQLEMQLDRLRKNPNSTIEVVERAFHLATPGPVEIVYARSLRSALLLRCLWENAVGTPIGRRAFDAVERLAHLAISLICFDAVIAPENIEALVLSAGAQYVEAYDERIILRASVVTNTHDYEFCAQPGKASSALIIGCTSSIEHSQVLWPQIEQRVAEILQKLLRLDKTTIWSISKLCLVMRPYWMIRLPGAMFTVAIGECKGPAPDARGEAQLHGRHVPSEFILKERRSSTRSLEESKSLALAALKKIFSNARGILERGEQRRAVQRAKLRDGLQSELAQEALEYGGNTQVVRLLHSFIGRLIESGGPRKENLAFSSIEAYFSSIAEELIHQAWDFDFEAADIPELNALFESINNRLQAKHGDLAARLFCNHLRDELGIPFFNERWFSHREPIRIRSNLALPSHVAQAIAILNRQRTEDSRNAAVFLCVAQAYGLRRLEVFGLSCDQFDPLQPMHLAVQRTLIADLKTRSGRRVLARSMGSDSVNAHIKRAVQLAKASTRAKGFLFESPTREKHITYVTPVAALATDALRQATGTSTVVPHSLRHTFATLVGIALFAPRNGSGGYLETLAQKHLSQSYAYQTEQLLQLPKDWPFGVDAIAVVLGQADARTFLNVYFHGSHLVIADRCEEWQPQHITQVRLSNMLNRERTSISKIHSRISSSKSRKSFDVVTELVKRLNHQHATTAPSIEDLDTHPRSSDRWELYFRALHYRIEANTSLEVMTPYAIDGLGMDSGLAKRCEAFYKSLVTETALDDFEPQSSELISPLESHQTGVLRGTVEREDFVARTQSWANAHPSNFARLQQLLTRWFARVRDDRPSVVCQSLTELEESTSVLIAIGAKSNQLRIQLHGDVEGTWLSTARDLYPDAPISRLRASRGSPRVKVAEASILMTQTSGSLIPDGRDLHRALIGLYLAIWSRFNATNQM